jgi:hypothetical protein
MNEWRGNGPNGNGRGGEEGRKEQLDGVPVLLGKEVNEGGKREERREGTVSPHEGGGPIPDA